MDFIERIFHVSPDHGSGLTELAFLLLVPIALFAAAALRKRLSISD
jgi:hypothetical protein